MHPLPPNLLPLAGAHAGRSARTCALKCGSACFHAVPNPTENEYFGDIVTRTVGRRSILKAGAAALVVGAVGSPLLAPRTADAKPRPNAQEAGSNSGTGLRFAPIAPTDASYDNVVVPAGYDWAVVARWGDPVEDGAPAWRHDEQTPAAAARQFGYNCDFIGFLPLGRGGAGAASQRGLLTVNHEYTEPERMFPGYLERADTDDEGNVTGFNPTRAEVRIELAAHGLSVVEVRRATSGAMRVVDSSRFNRRITATTPMRLTGPAAGHDLLKTSDDPSGTRVRGTLNNCAGGVTPWGTVLTAEENFNQYFANHGSMPEGEVKDAHARYGLPEGESDRRWERFYDRFDLTKEPNEPFRFGWIVEIDPSDPDFVPRKRTALGRMKHEGADIAIAEDGRVVAYMGDDERFDYVYKFVSRRRYREGDRAHNLGLLDGGDLFVARFDGDSPPAQLERYNDPENPGRLPKDRRFDGSGRWIPLIRDGESQVPGFSVAEVLIKTRLAADVAGGTKMDRPEDIQRNPVNGRVYMAMTNNTRRGVEGNPGVDEANPRRVDETGATTGNKYGHVVELTENDNDAGARTFAWRLFLVCGDPEDPTTFFSGFDKDAVSPIACPDNLAFDGNGNLWISTDGQPGTIGRADAFHAVPVQGPERGRTRQFLSVPAGAEASGPEFTPDQRNLFCSVQHPGEGIESHWPDFNRNPPRPSVIAVFKTSGNGPIGS